MKYNPNSEKSSRFYCPSCHCNHIKKRWPFETGDKRLSVLWCGCCGFGWRYPIPTQAQLEALYCNQRVYYLNYMRESSGGFPIRIKRISNLRPQKGRLLDIGSGPGFFLNVARNEGWVVEGIEPRTEAVKFCYDNFNIKVHEGLFENFTNKLGDYNVITLWDVLEHVSDHLQFIDRCIDLLAPGGMLVIAIPNASGWPARIFKGHWRYVMSNHLNYYTMDYIEQILSGRYMSIERADHTIKVHSLIQGLVSWLPYNVNINKIFKIGSIDAAKETSQFNPAKTPGSFMREISPLRMARMMAFKLNMIPLPRDIGDLVDIYCRKNS